jgi:hypothetical protein
VEGDLEPTRQREREVELRGLRLVARVRHAAASTAPSLRLISTLTLTTTLDQPHGDEPPEPLPQVPRAPNVPRD